MYRYLCCFCYLNSVLAVVCLYIGTRFGLICRCCWFLLTMLLYCDMPTFCYQVDLEESISTPSVTEVCSGSCVQLLCYAVDVPSTPSLNFACFIMLSEITLRTLENMHHMHLLACLTCSDFATCMCLTLLYLFAFVCSSAPTCRLFCRSWMSSLRWRLAWRLAAVCAYCLHGVQPSFCHSFCRAKAAQ